MTNIVGKPVNAQAIPDFDQNVKWYFVTARFRRSAPVYVSLDDYLGEHDRAAAYGIDLQKLRKPFRSCF